MSRPTPPVDPAPDVRGRTVVWSAGSSPTRGRRGSGSAWRAAGLVLASVAAVLTLAYAVQAWHVIAPPTAGASVPLWLPDALPVDEARAVDASRPSSRPSPVPTAGRVSPAPVTAPTSGPHPVAPRSSEAHHADRTATAGPRALRRLVVRLPLGLRLGRLPPSDEALDLLLERPRRRVRRRGVERLVGRRCRSPRVERWGWCRRRWLGPRQLGERALERQGRLRQGRLRQGRVRQG